MSENVVKFKPAIVGERYRFDPDEILEAAKGAKFSTLAILAEYEDGRPYIAGNCNAGETIILLERLKHHLIFGGDDE